MTTSTLTPAARTALAAIVGESHITTDPGMLASYAWETGIGSVPSSEKFSAQWPVAVVQPATVDEVSGVVRCCIQHQLKFRAHSTGYGSMNHVHGQDTISIDLRRMTYLEIDAKHRMAIIGPYVTASMLQAEAFKHGLTCHIIGAGPAHSPLASATSMIGVGITSNGTSMNMRNLLSWEWVTPEGEIVRGGAAGTGCGWFASDGPGPGFRGMIRGFFGASGALGVFTRIGIKLYPWPDHKVAENTGELPQLGMQIPQGCELYHAVWDHWDDQRRASFELTDAAVAFAMLRMPPDHLGWTLTGSNAEYVAQVRSGTLERIACADMEKNWTLVTASFSEGEKHWKDHVIRDIVSRTNGRLVELRPAIKELLFRNIATSHYVPRVLRPSGGITTSFGVLDSFHFLQHAIEAGEETLGDDVKPDGRLVQGGREAHWIWPHENRYMWAENIIDFDPAQHESRKAAGFALLNHFAISFRDPVGTLPFVIGPIMDLLGNSIGSPQHYMRQIKNTLDPQDHSHANEYVELEMSSTVQKWLPRLRPLILTRPVLKLAARILAKRGMT